MTPEPFRADVPQPVLDDPRARLARARWPDALGGAGRRPGTDPAFLRRLCAHWDDGLDWRAQGARLNAPPPSRAAVDGVGLHLVHARAAAADAVPVPLANGWPGSIFERLDLIPRLTLHWATGAIGSSRRLHAEAFADRDAQAPPERGRVPVGVAVFPRDVLPAPRAWGERRLNPVHRTEAPRGGHFPVREQPDPLCADIRAFAGAPH